MAGSGSAVLGKWLALHGLEASDCLHLLSRGGMAAPPPRPADPAFDSAAALPLVLGSLYQSLPPASEVLARIAADVRVDLARDPQRPSRAFTLHDDGRSLPYIYCPLKGRTSDILVLAHELGHACQILASRMPGLQPISRELAAYLSEGLVLRAIVRTDGAKGAILDALYRQGTAQIMRRHGSELLDALGDPSAPYSYDWNYPIARELAGRALRHLEPQAQWDIFTGRMELSELLNLPGA